MQKKLLAAAIVSALGASTAAIADTASPHTITGNAGLFTSYRFRGIDQTFGEPAIQGGIDYSHSSGLYLGNWNSNVSEYAGFPEGNLEMDFYGGYKTSLGPIGLDVGALYYYYPGSRISAANADDVDNTEIYLGLSWNFLTFKYSYAVSDYFDLKGSNGEDTDGTQYFDLGASYDLGGGWGVNGHVGYLDFKHDSDFNYTDWKVGVTKDLGGWIVGLSYVGTDAKESKYTWTKPSGETHDASKDVLVASVTKSF